MQHCRMLQSYAIFEMPGTCPLLGHALRNALDTPALGTYPLKCLGQARSWDMHLYAPRNAYFCLHPIKAPSPDKPFISEQPWLQHCHKHVPIAREVICHGELFQCRPMPRFPALVEKPDEAWVVLSRNSSSTQPHPASRRVSKRIKNGVRTPESSKPNKFKPMELRPLITHRSNRTCHRDIHTGSSNQFEQTHIDTHVAPEVEDHFPAQRNRRDHWNRRIKT